jgi:Tfp pilus assembly protein PilX
MNGALARRPQTPRGQVLVIVSLGFVVLIGMLGLAIDGGRGYWERRQAQNAADHAALAAAWASCHSLSPQTAGQQAATDNGFTHNGTTTWVEITGSSGTWQAIVRSRLSTTFASVLGFQTITAAGRAKARCESSTGIGYAIFAGGDHCGSDSSKLGLDFAGSNNTVTGDVHSNFNVNVGGDNNEFDGAFTHVGTESHHVNTDFYPVAPGPGPVAPNDYPQPSGVLGWPITFSADHYRQLADADMDGVDDNPLDDYFYVNGTISGSFISTNGPGVYYATGLIDADLSGLGTLANPFKVTLVAGGSPSSDQSDDKVKISGSNMFLEPYEADKLLAFSDLDFAPSDWVKRCTEPGVQMSGSNNSWKGYIYAPTSQADFNGSSGSTLNGSIIAWSVKMSGSSVNNTADVAPIPGPKVLELLE